MRAVAFWAYTKELDGHQNSCEKCSGNPKLKKVWGCSDNSDLPDFKRTVYRLGEIQTYNCPLKTLNDPFVQKSVELFSFFEKGILPNDKLSEETQVYRSAMNLLSVYKEKAQGWYQDELEKKRKVKKAS